MAKGFAKHGAVSQQHGQGGPERVAVQRRKIERFCADQADSVV